VPTAKIVVLESGLLATQEKFTFWLWTQTLDFLPFMLHLYLHFDRYAASHIKHRSIPSPRMETWVIIPATVCIWLYRCGLWSCTLGRLRPCRICRHWCCVGFVQAEEIPPWRNESLCNPWWEFPWKSLSLLGKRHHSDFICETNNDVETRGWKAVKKLHLGILHKFQEFSIDSSIFLTDLSTASSNQMFLHTHVMPWIALEWKG